ncbi:AraC-like DNA-binding protein [Dyadobacter jejuensis]|uniref:AraC-like DNA-binding protein n=1 Tax=Dyadobacter jejuensis TaxID=1082580 RepID=A0A316AUA5_9BACT|nr:AraC family transcriptional regulator [Dyadobacter jejuensis]PWJ60270.1 AraC-like DNA-binding protein [Dyadobacter jejuensis]
MPAEDNLHAQTLHDLYRNQGIPLEGLETESGFTIHFLEESFKELPYRSAPFRPYYFSFLFIKNASGKYTIDDRQFEVSSHTAYFTNPGNYRLFEWDRIEHTCLITFSEAFLKTYVHRDVYKDFSFLLSETVSPRILSDEQFEQVEVLYQLIRREYKGHATYKNKIIGSLMVALLLKLKEYFFQDYHPLIEGTRSSLIVKTFKQNLEQHFQELIHGKVDRMYRVQDYAGLQALHANYLSSVVKSKTGKAIGQWIAERLTTEARLMLLNPRLTIKEIAFRLGFLETAHFSNHFKKHTGLSPVEYRKQESSKPNS